MPKSVLFDKHAVMDKVTDLFWRKGYNGTSMQDLVDVTGLNRSSFYNTYQDKFHLFEESLKHYQQRQNEFTTKYLNQPRLTPRESLVSLFKAFHEQALTGDSKGCFLSNCTAEFGNTDPEVTRFLSGNMDMVVSVFQKFIEKAQESGEIDPEKDAHQLALFLFSSMQGIRITSMIDSNQKDISLIINQVISAL